ncbi:EAL domain, c-di-GMP-specific phosphodiesterase class I (or its enzymatically inactive variant) [Arthrobacter sp. ov407]|nr:EAL domain, c-di-GMP-specific phosphodiesterase class I (or its enzymatically inactive variant) [Arthrobacter sp. ov407]
MLAVLSLESVLALSILLPVMFGLEPWGGREVPARVSTLASILLLPVVLHAAWRLIRQQHRDRIEAFTTASLMDTVLSTTRGWLWAVGADGRFTFSSLASRELLGYEPSDLVGRPCSLIIDLADLKTARKPNAGAGRGGLLLSVRHRGGRRLSVEVVCRRRFDREGRGSGFEGIARPLDISRAGSPEDQEISARLDRLFATRTLITAFQPICHLGTGEIVGAEALTRFVSSPFRSPDQWFDEADSIGRGLELEFLALETAMLAAADLPAPLYIAVNLSPSACLDPRLSDILRDSGLNPGRIVVELTERSAVADYARLAAALAPLRSAGLRIAVDDVGAGFSSMRHILRLSPELIKLDRTIVAGIDKDPKQRALCTAMVSFSSQIGASLVAEGIETNAELTAVTEMGVNTGQGYLLGRPSVLPSDWSHWRPWNRSSPSGCAESRDT